MRIRGASEFQAAASLGPAMASLAAKARTDPVLFSQFVLRDEENGRPIRLAPMHVEWHDILDAHDRAVIWTHTEAGKSAQLSVGRVLYEIGKNPNIRILILGAALGAAKKIVKALKNYIENSTEFRMVFPHVRPDKTDTTGLWRNDAFHVQRTTRSKDPTVQASGFEGRILGSRYDLILIDDYLTPENTHSAEQRDKYYGWLKSTIEGRRTARGRLWFIGNTWNHDDAMHRYAAEPSTFSKKYPVMTDAGESSWPEVWPLDRIAKAVEDRGPIESRRTLFCDPVADADRRFKVDYILRALKLGDGLELAYALSVVPPGYRTITGVDLAVTKKDASDETALVTIAVEDKTQERQLLDITAGKWGGPEIVSRIMDVQHRYNSIVHVESNACFPAGTPVLTRERGYVPIEDVQIGEHTWTHRARWRAVTDTLSGTGRRVSPLRASGSLEVVPTSNHWFLMREAGRTSGCGGGHHRPVGHPQWVSAGFAQSAAYAAIATPRWSAVEPVIQLPRTKQNVPRLVMVDERIAMFLGLYMAEGHCDWLRGEAQPTLTLSHAEGYIARWATGVMRDLAPERSITTKKRDATLRVTVSSTALGRALKPIGKGSSKTLPIEWLGWPLHLRIAAVRGWLIGDGSYVENNKRSKSRSRKFVGHSISRNWIMWARASLLEAGFRPTIAEEAPHTSEIDGRTVQCSTMYKLDLNADDSRALIASMNTSIERQRWMLDRVEADQRVRRGASRSHHEGGHLWSFVLHGSGNYQALDSSVYNLKVDEDESFTANDYVVHNAQAYIKQFVEDKSAVPIKAFYTGKNKIDPSFGVESIAVEMSAGKWVFPNHGGTSRGIHARMDPEVKKLINELLRYDPASHTGDRLMALWLAREGARKAFSPPGVGKRPRRT